MNYFSAKEFLTGRNTWLILCLIAGLLFNGFSFYLRDYLIWILAFLMTVSLSAFSVSDFVPFSRVYRRMAGAVLLSYLAFGLLLLGVALAIVPADRDMLLGFVFIALAPPGVVIVPFSTLLKADVKHAVVGVMGGYLALLVIFPLTVVLVLGRAFVDYGQLLSLIGYFILLPFLLSRLLSLDRTRAVMNKWRASLINLSFSLIVYVVVGLNRDIIVGQIGEIVKPMLILALVLFGGGWVLEYALRKRSMPRERIKTLGLLFNVKNTGFSAVTALALLNERAALPSAALSVVLLLYLIYLSLRERFSPQFRIKP